MEATLTLTQAILAGEHDGELDGIVGAVRDRQKYLAKINAADLGPGDTVQFSEEIRPRYLVGLEATVVRVNDASVTVSCPDDQAYGRFRNAKSVRCPNSLIAGRA